MCRRRGVREVALKPEQLAAVYRARMREITLMENFTRLPETHFDCAACRRGARLIMVDGNFKVWHYKSATRANASQWDYVVCGAPGTPRAFFASAAQVDAILLALHKAKVADGMYESCGPTRVKAMEGVAQSGRSAMDVTGMFSACCPHGIYLRAFDFNGGEKGSYPLAMYQPVGIPAKILVGDTLCRCGKCFAKARELSELIAEHLPEGLPWTDLPDELAVNVMHVLAVRAAPRRSHRSGGRR